MKVLLVSPRFPPASAADMHRVRLLLPHAREGGWEADVLCLESDSLRGPEDPGLADRLPKGLVVHRIRPWGWPPRLGINAAWIRSLWPLYRAGASLLARGNYDVVFFSTTEFPLHVLGPLWKRRFAVPFCMDYQDPWVNDYYKAHPGIVPPGGRIKYFVADRLNRMMEPFVARRCAGFLAVSQAYLDDLERRYGRVSAVPRLVRPFPAEPGESSPATPIALSDPIVWRYVGRGGPDIHLTVRSYLRAWVTEAARKPALREARLEAIGTSYAPAGQGKASLVDIAAEYGMQDALSECTDRVPYSKALELLSASHALIVFGSNDPTYTASKIYPYLLARRPLLTIFHERSPAARLIEEVGGAVSVTFSDVSTVESIAADIEAQWFASGRYHEIAPLNEIRFEAHTARRQAAEVGEWLRAVRAGAARI